MSKNVTLWGASYSDVPSIEVPSTGGGVAAFHDVSDTTAVASDVASGKLFHDANGALTAGTGSSTTVEPLSVTENGTYTAPTGTAYSPVTVNVSGGGGTGGDEWTRPRGWPDYSQVTLGDNEIFLTYDLTLYGVGSSFNKCDIRIGASNETITVERGYLSNGTFVSETAETLTNASRYFGVVYSMDLSSVDEDYAVIRLTSSGNITVFYCTNNKSPLVEVYGKSGGLVTLNNGGLNLSVYTQSITMFGTVRLPGCGNLFIGLSSLENIDIPNFDTSGSTTFTNAFRGCSSLRKLPKFTVSSACNNMQSMFHDCRSLLEVDTTGWDTSNVTTMQDMCVRCSSLKKIDLSVFNFGKVTTVQNMFNDCSAFSEIDLHGKDLSKITNMSGLVGYASVARVDFSNITHTTALTNMNSMLRQSNVEVIDVRPFDLSHITNFGLFAYDSKAKKVYMPSSTVMIASDSFRNMNNLEEFHIEATTPPSLGSADAIKKNANLVVYVPYSADHSVLAAYQSATNWSSYASYMQEESA